MRRSRRRHTNESLDMLLDTITNMFGGIIFIAILVAMMTGRQTIQKTGQIEAATDRLLNMRTDIQEGGSRLLRKADLATFLQGLIREPDVSWDVTLRQLAADTNVAVQRLDRAERQLRHLKDKKAPIDEKLRTASEHGDRLQEEIERLQAAIQGEKKLRTLDARLPVTRITHKRPAHIVLTQGKMFIVDGCSGGLSAVVDETARDVDLTSLPGNQTGIELKSNAGLRIDDHLASTSRWRKLRTAAPSKRYFLYLMVRPDAFKEFLIVRQLAVSAGYDYNVVPLTADDSLILSPARQLMTQ